MLVARLIARQTVRCRLSAALSHRGLFAAGPDQPLTRAGLAYMERSW